jgi:hypothetical protein
MSEPCLQPLSLEELVDYERGELTPAASDRIEEHFFACGNCARRLETISRVGAGVADLVREGRLSASVTVQLLDDARERGVRLRSYRLAPGESVACTAGPTDDFVVIRLVVDVEEGESVDVASEVQNLETGEGWSQTTEDVAVDRRGGELVYAFAGDRVRSLPRTRWTMRAQVHGPRGDRQLGPYILDHTPWKQLSARP